MSGSPVTSTGSSRLGSLLLAEIRDVSTGIVLAEGRRPLGGGVYMPMP